MNTLFKEIEKEIDDSVASKYEGVEKVALTGRPPHGTSNIRWFCDQKQVAFLLAHFNRKTNQWENIWRIE